MKKYEEVWSKVDKIPRGNATDNITKGCLVLEGGAFRGVFTNGVIDYLMYSGINLDTVIGVSAGALNGLNYVSGQIGRAARLNLTYRHDSRYVGAKALRKNKGIYGFDFAYDWYDKIEPLNVDRLNSGKQRFVAVVTRLEDGKALYKENGVTEDIMQAVRASASMPFVSKPVLVDNEKCLDGGSADKIPYQWAIDEGVEKIVVVSTRPIGFEKPVSDKNKNHIRKFYKNYPEFAEGLVNVNAFENSERRKLEKLAEEGRVCLISPPEFITEIGRLEPDMEKLGHLYYLGYKAGKDNLERVKTYLGMN